MARSKAHVSDCPCVIATTLLPTSWHDASRAPTAKRFGFAFIFDFVAHRKDRTGQHDVSLTGAGVWPGLATMTRMKMVMQWRASTYTAPPAASKIAGPRWIAPWPLPRIASDITARLISFSALTLQTKGTELVDEKNRLNGHIMDQQEKATWLDYFGSGEDERQEASGGKQPRPTDCGKSKTTGKTHAPVDAILEAISILESEKSRTT